MKSLNVLTFVMMLVITLIFYFGFPYESGFACSCLKPGTPMEELEKSAAVFSGKVIQTVDENKNARIRSSADPIAVTFKVNTSWEGIDQSQVTVYTVRDSAACGYEFQKNEEYIVYAHAADDHKLHTGLCSRTALLADAQTDIEQLGPGIKPKEPDDSKQASSEREAAAGEKSVRGAALEQEVKGLLIGGYSFVMGIAFIIVFIQWIRHFQINSPYLWILLHFILFSIGVVWFFKAIEYTGHRSMVSEEMSLRMGISGVWWALSMVSLIIGILKFDKKKE